MPEEVVTYFLETQIYVIAFIFVMFCTYMLRSIFENRRRRKTYETTQSMVKQLSVDNQAIKHYIKDKGVQDFIATCKKYDKKGYIPPESKATLLRIYDDLSNLGANGEREIGLEMINKLEVKEDH